MQEPPFCYLSMMDFFNAKEFTPSQAPPIANGWGQPSAPTPMWRPDFADDEELKKAIGIELAQGLDLFKAGMKLFNEELPKALWASVNWKNDPIVIASRDAYLKTLKKLEKPLDKEELLYEVLASARNAAEDRDRVQFLKLYSEIAGFTGKVTVDASTNYNNTNNTMTIKLVKPENRQISQAPVIQNDESKMLNDELPIKLKLVGGTK